MTQTFKIAILGASGYTGAELTRIIATHPLMEIVALSADRKAGMKMGDVFPHLSHLELPDLVTLNDVNFKNVDLVFCALPHGITQEVILGLPENVKVVDLSADFRLRDASVYKKWYGMDHKAMNLQKEVAYGLPEFYRDDIKAARITANTGCYVATALIPLIPLLQAGLLDPEEIIIDAKSGVTGAGRAPAEGILFAEVSEGFHAYAIDGHRHMGELDQELSKAAGKAVTCSFTPHLLPQNRGILATSYVRGDAKKIHKALETRFKKETFVHVLPIGQAPATRHVRGSNICKIGVVADRRPGRAKIISVLDNLMKGSSGQAIQCANLMLGIDEETGISMAPVFP